MARTDKGHKLDKLVVQPGSTFTETQVGFDTGSRTVICDVSRALELLPQIGTSDYEIFYWTQIGDHRGSHPFMFVKETTVTTGANNIATISISFEGLIVRNGERRFDQAKAPYFTPGVREVSDQLDGVNLSIFLQEITKTYLAGNLRDLPILNKITDPPFEGSNLSQLYNKGTATALRRPDFHGWTITNRTYRLAGVLGKLAIYEVNDTYSEHALWFV